MHNQMTIEAIPLQFCRTLAEVIRRILSDQEQQLAPTSPTGDQTATGGQMR